MPNYTHKYLMTFENCTAKLLVWYRSGELRKIERKSGSFNLIQWASLTNVLPYMEKDIKSVTQRTNGRVKFQLLADTDKESIYKQFMEVYFRFFNQLNGIDPKVTAIEGKALKQIIIYLSDQSADEAEAVSTWQQILTNWDKLDEFYQKQVQIRQINSNLPNLITQLLHGKTGTTKARKAASVSDDLRKGI